MRKCSIADIPVSARMVIRDAGRFGIPFPSCSSPESSSSFFRVVLLPARGFVLILRALLVLSARDEPKAEATYVPLLRKPGAFIH
jgi:hypothetical protein